MAKALIISDNFSRNKKKQQETAVVILNSNQDVVFSILDKLEPIDRLRFTAVCKQWLAFPKKYYLTSQRWSTQLVPMLLILKEGKLRLYNVCAGKIDNNIQLSVLPVKRFCGSSRGWLATVAKDPTDPTVDACEYYRLYKDDVIIQLWNPLDKATSPLCLPPLELGCGVTIRKVILLLDPLRGNNYIVAAVTDSKLALFRAGQKDWTRIQALGKCNDLILYKGRIYGAQNNGSLWSLDVNHSSTETRPKLVTTLNPTLYKRVHIVNSNTTGDLLLLQRSCKLQTPYPDEPYSFKIYKLVIDDNGSLVRRVEIKSIGDEAIFVGGGYQSVSVFASKFPGCQPNSIYYTTDFGESPKTIGVCNLQDRTISKLDPFDGSKLMRLALWILPRCNGLSLSYLLNS